MAWIRRRPLGLVYRDAAKSSGGYTLFSPARGHHASLLDADGRMVHTWYHPEGIQHVRLLQGGHLLVETLPPENAEGAEQIGGSAGALLELDWDGRVVWEYRDRFLHHDYQRLPSGNHLVIAWDRLPAELQGRVQGGHAHHDDPERMWADVIKEIGPDGTIVRVWRSWEHLSFDEDRICPLESHKEWTHANSLEILPDGRWLVSFRLTSTVVIIEPESGRVDWRWGPGEVSHQHHATWLEGERILVFDNGCHRLRAPSYSQIVEVDAESREIVWRYTSPTIVAFYSFMVSGCERLPDGNTFITEGATGRLFEITPEGETVWEWVSPWTLPSRFGPTPVVFRAYRIAADDPRLAGRDLEAGRHGALDARIAAHEMLGEADEPR